VAGLLSKPDGDAGNSADVPCPSLGDVVMTANPLMAAPQQAATAAEPVDAVGADLPRSNSGGVAAVPSIVAVGSEGEVAVSNPLRARGPANEGNKGRW
jgi:hypothetical protein